MMSYPIPQHPSAVLSEHPYQQSSHGSKLPLMGSDSSCTAFHGQHVDEVFAFECDAYSMFVRRRKFQCE
jgi:hypothetical protein